MRAGFAAILISLLTASLPMPAQTVSSSARSAELAAQFNKNKHVVKVKRGNALEKYKDVRAEPAFRSNPAGYSGMYEGDFGFTLRLDVQSDGRVEGSGKEPTGETNVRRNFVLRDSRIDGSLLVGTWVYSVGVREKLEGVFINRTTRESATDPGVTRFGVGVIGQPRQVGGQTIERLFYERTSY
jgi:hypothetical protein